MLLLLDAAPDGKEVEIQLIGGGEAAPDLNPHNTPLSSCCEPGCSCICHLQWPGMKLIWVPMDADDSVEDETDEEQEGEDWEEHEEVEKVGSETVDGVEPTPETDESEELKQNKTKFHQSLDVIIAEGHRRRSDPGPHSALNLAVTRSQSPPVPPKQSQSGQIPQKPVQSEEENIYEATLPVVGPIPKKSSAVCKELDIPLIKVRKPARRSKLSYSTSDPTSEFQANLEPNLNPDEMPPAIPPRMPMAQDSRSLTPVHRGGIPLPQPTVEEWRILRPSSPSSSSASGLRPQRAITPPPNSPHRPPPPPPKADPRRLSTASLQSLTQKKGLYWTNTIIFAWDELWIMHKLSVFCANKETVCLFRSRGKWGKGRRERGRGGRTVSQSSDSHLIFDFTF